MKPANIIMTERGDEWVPVLVDFGLALSESTGGDQRGTISGTPMYMSPEQAGGEGHRIDGRTDIYSLGVVLYAMLSGQPPFRAKSTAELLRQVIEDEPTPPRQFARGIPRDVEQICLKAMARQINDRYTTAGDLAEDLRSLLKQAEPAPVAMQSAVAVPAPALAQKAPVQKSTVNSDRTPTVAAGPPRIPTVKSKPVDRMKLLIAEDHELTRFIDRSFNAFAWTMRDDGKTKHSHRTVID